MSTPSPRSTHDPLGFRDHASYGGGLPSRRSGIHVYTVEWTPASVEWFVDGTPYIEANIQGRINGTEEFHRPFFLLLNLAVGRRLARLADSGTAFPARMLRRLRAGVSAGHAGARHRSDAVVEQHRQPEQRSLRGRLRLRARRTEHHDQMVHQGAPVRPGMATPARRQRLFPRNGALCAVPGLGRNQRFGATGTGAGPALDRRRPGGTKPRWSQSRWGAAPSARRAPQRRVPRRARRLHGEQRFQLQQSDCNGTGAGRRLRLDSVTRIGREAA